MTAAEQVSAAYRRIAEVERPEVWIALRPEADVLADAAALDARVAAGQRPALAGLTLAVKDNIDVLPLPTTAGCPSFAYAPRANAPAAQRLLDAGAILIGKTNLDQFATGLVGTRSPYGAVRDARRPDHISGGSSSGSAVAVALGIVDLALGTDTAGSGRVPAAFQGIVGIKPTRGLVPALGVVPACRTIDCVTVFARELETAERAMAAMVGPDERDPLSRPWPADAPLSAPPTARVGVPGGDALSDLTPAARAAFEATTRRLQDAGATVTSVDLAPFLAAGELLYGGAFVAERHAAVGAFVEAHRDEVDPTVGSIIAAAGRLLASQLAADRERVDHFALWARSLFEAIDALLMPTTTRQPTLAAVAADPIGENTKLGRYTSAVNLLDLSAVSVPAGTADGGQFGVSVIAPAFADRVAAGVARLLSPGALALTTPRAA